MCRYIIDPQNEGVLLPPKGPDANVHQQKYKISSHVHRFLKQFAQWRNEKLFGAAGPWKLLKNLNSKLEASARQCDMTGPAMFQAMYVLAPDSAVTSVSCALPSPSSLVMASAPQKATSVSAGTLLSTKSKGAKAKTGDKVMCIHCREMFGKQGIRNHEAKCAEKTGTLKSQPLDDIDDDDNHDDQPEDFDDLYFLNGRTRKRTTFKVQPSPSTALSAADDAPKTAEQKLAKVQKELEALQKQQQEQKALKKKSKLVSPSSSDSSSSSSSSNSSPEKKKKSQQKKKSGQSAAELRAKAKSAAAAAEAAAAEAVAAEAAATAAAGKRKKNKNKKKEKKEKKKEQDEDSSCNDDSSNNSDGSPPSSSDDDGHRRQKKQRTDADRKSRKRKSRKRRSAPTTEVALNWLTNQSRTNQAILAERARMTQRMYQLVHNYLSNLLSDFTFGCAGTRVPRCRPSCSASCYRRSTLEAKLLINVHKRPRIFIFIFIFIFYHIHIHIHIHIYLSLIHI